MDKRDSVYKEPGPDHTKKFHDHELVIDPTEPDPSELDEAKGFKCLMYINCLTLYVKPWELIVLYQFKVYC